MSSDLHLPICLWLSSLRRAFIQLSMHISIKLASTVNGGALSIYHARKLALFQPEVFTQGLKKQQQQQK